MICVSSILISSENLYLRCLIGTHHRVVCSVHRCGAPAGVRPCRPCKRKKKCVCEPFFVCMRSNFNRLTIRVVSLTHSQNNDTPFSTFLTCPVKTLQITCSSTSTKEPTHPSLPPVCTKAGVSHDTIQSVM